MGSALGPEVARADDMSVELLSPGAEPRAAIRYEPACGQGRRAVVEVEQTLYSEFALGTGVHRLEVLPSHVCEDTEGEVTGRYQVLSASGKLRRRDGEEEPEHPAVTKAREEVSRFQGSNIRRLAPSMAEFDADPLGRVGRVRLRVPDHSMAPFRRILESYWRLTLPCAVLPEEPIGPGATWRVTATSAWLEEAGGLTAEFRDRSTLEYELLEVDGERFVVRFSGKSRGSESMDVAGLATLSQGFRGEVTGQSVCSTRGMFPLEAQIGKKAVGILGLSGTITKGAMVEQYDEKSERTGVLTLRVNPL